MTVRIARSFVCAGILAVFATSVGSAQLGPRGGKRPPEATASRAPVASSPLRDWMVQGMREVVRIRMGLSQLEREAERISELEARIQEPGSLGEEELALLQERVRLEKELLANREQELLLRTKRRAAAHLEEMPPEGSAPEDPEMAARMKEHRTIAQTILTDLRDATTLSELRAALEKAQEMGGAGRGFQQDRLHRRLSRLMEEARSLRARLDPLLQEIRMLREELGLPPDADFQPPPDAPPPMPPPAVDSPEDRRLRHDGRRLPPNAPPSRP